MKHKLLFVDDEINVLKGIKRLFIGTEYDVFIETDTEKALELVGHNKYSVIISDMRMPNMNGSKFINKANEIDNMSIKIILSGYSDIEDIMTAINEGHIYSYITKPWHDAGLKLLIKNASELYEKKIREKVLIKKLYEKRKLLLELNSNLEDIVKERTEELKEVNYILNQIISGASEEVIYNRLAVNLKKVNDDSKVMLIVNNNDILEKYGDTFTLPESFLFKLQTSKKYLTYDNFVAIPLKYNDLLLGAVLLNNNLNKKIEEIVNDIKTFYSTARLYMKQKLFINNSSELISSIDSIIGDINE